MLMPKRTRYRKPHRGDINHQTASRGTEVSFGEFGLQTVEAAWIDNRQIEAARRAITREIRRGGKVWIRIFPDKAITAKPAETRMGKGKGAPERWVAPVRPGRVMFELAGVRREVAMEALRKAGHKLPVKTKIVEREGAPTETEQ